MTGMAIPYYNNFTSEKNLTVEAQKIADVLNLARKKALVGEGTSCELQSYQVDVPAGGLSYALKKCCSGVACANVQSYTIPSSTSVSINSAPDQVQFNVLTGTASTNLTIKMKSTVGKCVDVEVATMGTIDVGDIYTAGC